MAGRNCQGGGTLPHVDGPASWQAKNSTGSFHFSIPLPNGEWYDFFQAAPRGGMFPHYIVEHDNKATWGYQGSERDNIKAIHHLLKVAGRHALSGNCPVYLFGHYQTKQADSDPNCDELKGQLQLLLQEKTVEDKYYKSPSEKAKYSIVDV